MARFFKEKLGWTEGKIDGSTGKPFPERWGFYCPGCALQIAAQNPDMGPDTVHLFSVHIANVRDVHRFNFDANRPTLEPSLLVTGGSGDRRCHSYVRDGRIQFLSDCTHPLAGQTIDLPEIVHPPCERDNYPDG